MTRLLRQKDAAELLGVSVRTLEKWRLEGRGPAYHKLGSSVRYAIEELEAYVASGVVTTTDSGPSSKARKPSKPRKPRQVPTLDPDFDDEGRR